MKESIRDQAEDSSGATPKLRRQARTLFLLSSGILAAFFLGVAVWSAFWWREEPTNGTPPELMLFALLVSVSLSGLMYWFDRRDFGPHGNESKR